ncbi:MAG: hypothetical protein ACYTFW_00185 [Planctomycetota bacterium]|jgi:hypothetical protein
MDKDIVRVINKNIDVIEFIREQLREEPDLKEPEIKNRIYEEFGFDRFRKKTIVVQVLIAAAREAKG